MKGKIVSTGIFSANSLKPIFIVATISSKFVNVSLYVYFLFGSSSSFIELCKPVATKAKKAISNFKVRQGMKIGAKVVTSLVVQTFFSIAIPIIAKKIINSVVKNAATEWFGEDLGNAMLAGAGKYLGGNGTSGGQSAGSMEKVMAYLGEQQTVSAKEAEYQRAVKSPFDITSPYTFLGSLAYAVMPMAYSSGGVSSAVTNMSTLTSNAIAAISPGASAVELGRKIDSVGECPLLENMGAVGDASCNEYVITDPATIREAPLTVKEQVADLTDENESLKEMLSERSEGVDDSKSERRVKRTEQQALLRLLELEQTIAAQQAESVAALVKPTTAEENLAYAKILSSITATFDQQIEKIRKQYGFLTEKSE